MILPPDFCHCFAAEEKKDKDPGVISPKSKGNQEG